MRNSSVNIQHMELVLIGFETVDIQYNVKETRVACIRCSTIL